MSLQGCLSTTSLAFMPKRPVADDQNAKNDPQVKEPPENQSLYWNALVFFSARVLSHCGFILSLLAIWLAWLMPTIILGQPPTPETKTLKSRTKPPRRPVPLTPLPEVQRNLAPSILPTSATDNHQPARRVYFADAASAATIVNVTEPPAQAPVILQSSIPSQTTEASPQSSPSENAGDPSNSRDSLVFDSDSSSRPPSLKGQRLSKFKLFRSYSLDVTQTSMTGGEITPPLGVATLFLKGQRASLPSPKPATSRFPFRRCSGPAGQNVIPQSPKPIPRTMPYGAPYFATPPILLDRRSTSLSTRSQFKDDTLNSQAPESDSELSRGRPIRRIILSSTNRSMSENFTIL